MKVNIHPLTYIFLLIAFLSGYFEYMYILLLIIFIHESGHYFFSKLVNIKNPIITIYPFGGITKLNEELNTPLYKEFISLIGGIIFQIIFYLIIFLLYKNNFVSMHVFEIVKRINYLLLTFNFMPILPLDGGKLLNILFHKLFNYLIAEKLSIIVSILFSIIFLLFNRTFLALFLFVFLIKCIYFEILNLRVKYNVFLFERYSNKHKFKKKRYINSIKQFKRDYYHLINNSTEDIILYEIFDRNKRIC